MISALDDGQLAAIGSAIQQHLSDCRTAPPMTYILDLGIWHVGPFPTHQAAQHWAETHGCDDYRMIPLDDPAEAPGRIHRLRNPGLQLQQG